MMVLEVSKERVLNKIKNLKKLCRSLGVDLRYICKNPGMQTKIALSLNTQFNGLFQQFLDNRE